MKKRFALLFACCLLTSVPPLPASADQGVTVRIDGSTPDYDQPPVIVNGTTMIPFRKIFEILGATVTWNSTDQSVTATKRNVTLHLQIGSATATKNDARMEMAQPVQLISGRTMVPLRFVSEALGADVQWDTASHTVTVTSPEQLLLKAAKNNDLPTLKQLLAAGASTAVSDERGATPLMYEAEAGNTEAVQALLDNGANVNALDNGSMNALSYAAYSKEPLPVVQLLLKSGIEADHQNVSHSTPLMYFATMNDPQALQALLDAGANPNAQGDDGYCALYGAAKANKADNIKVLLAAGAKPDLKNPDGVTPLMTASFGGHTEAMQSLLTGGADLNAVDQLGNTAVFYAVFGRQLDALQWLIQQGADTHVKNKYQDTPLLYATEYDIDPKIAAALIPVSDVNAISNFGSSALHYAAGYDDTATMTALLQAGANPNTVNSYHQTALVIAACRGNTEGVQALLDAGADPMIKTEEGYTALTLANDYGQPAVVALLRQVDRTTPLDSVHPAFDQSAMAGILESHWSKQVVSGQTTNTLGLGSGEVGLLLTLPSEEDKDAFKLLSQSTKCSMLFSYVQSHWAEWPNVQVCEVYVVYDGKIQLETTLWTGMKPEDVRLDYRSTGLPMK